MADLGKHKLATNMVLAAVAGDSDKRRSPSPSFLLQGGLHQYNPIRVPCGHGKINSGGGIVTDCQIRELVGCVFTTPRVFPPMTIYFGIMDTIAFHEFPTDVNEMAITVITPWMKDNLRF